MNRVSAGSKRSLAAGGVAVLAALALGACGNTLDNDDLESQLVEQLSADAGVASDDVTVDCPDDIEAEEGKEFECTLNAFDDDVTVEVTLTDDEGGFEAVVPPEQFDE